MELKNYQKRVISDLNRYCEWLNETGSVSAAYKSFWAEKNVIVGLDTFGLMKSIAIVLVFLGVYIVTRSKSKAQMDAWKARAKADRPEQEPQS